jgi:hypothetical protein
VLPGSDGDPLLGLLVLKRKDAPERMAYVGELAFMFVENALPPPMMV